MGGGNIVTTVQPVGDQKDPSAPQPTQQPPYPYAGQPPNDGMPTQPNVGQQPYPQGGSPQYDGQMAMQQPQGYGSPQAVVLPPGAVHVVAVNGGLQPKIRERDVLVAYILCILFGAHRCYLKDPVGCLVYNCTGGLCYVMAILDMMNMDLLVKASERGMHLPIIATEGAFPPALRTMV
jgi:hypothetical protein